MMLHELRSWRLWRDLLLAAMVPAAAGGVLLAVLFATEDMTVGWLGIALTSTLALGALAAVVLTVGFGLPIHLANRVRRARSFRAYAIPAAVAGLLVMVLVEPATLRQAAIVGAAAVVVSVAAAALFWWLHVRRRLPGDDAGRPAR